MPDKKITEYEVDICYGKALAEVSNDPEKVKYLKTIYPISKYSNQILVSHLLAALEGQSSLRFVLAKIQHDFNLDSFFATLDYLNRRIKLYEAELRQMPNGMYDDKCTNLQIAYALSDVRINILRLTRSNIAILSETSPMSSRFNGGFNKLFNQLFKLLCEFESHETKSTQDKLSNIEILNYLSVAAKIDKNVFFEVVINNFDEFYTSEHSYNEIFETFLRLFSDKKDQLINRKSEFDSNQWRDAIKAIMRSVENKVKNIYPYAFLNKDNSVSFHIYQFNESNGKNCESCKSKCDCVELCDKFQTILNQESFSTQLDNLRKRLQLPLIDGAQPIISRKLDFPDNPVVITYNIKLTPEAIDTILKEHIQYSYRYENNILKLRKTFSAQLGYIWLAPVMTVPDIESHSMLRVAGCQVIELIAVQLLHLIPDWDGMEQNFHWVPKEVVEKLSLNHSQLDSILNKIYVNHGLLDQEAKYFAQHEDGTSIIKHPKPESSLRINSMNDNTMYFYAMYGNCNIEELQICQSLEIKTVVFLQYVYDQLKVLLNKYVNVQDIKTVKKSILLIEKMIKTEIQKSDKRDVSPSRFFQPADSRQQTELDLHVSSQTSQLSLSKK